MVLYFVFFFIQLHLLIIYVKISLLIHAIYVILIHFIFQVSQF